MVGVISVRKRYRNVVAVSWEIEEEHNEMSLKLESGCHKMRSSIFQFYILLPIINSQ